MLDLNNLFNKNFNSVLTVAELDHLINKNPLGESSIYYIRKNGELGVYIMLPSPLSNGKKNKYKYASYLCFSNKIRGIDIIKDLYNFIHEKENELGTDVIYGPPNEIGYLINTKIGGWKDLSELYVYSKKYSITMIKTMKF